ncbi:Uncharacterised protein [Candidatus Tiddalikarchaeum anstoanum]|nr:Uncharacterised protein [Candidatus Tiddalikarchaeum anstoanum]
MINKNNIQDMLDKYERAKSEVENMFKNVIRYAKSSKMKELNSFYDKNKDDYIDKMLASPNKKMSLLSDFEEILKNKAL